MSGKNKLIKFEALKSLTNVFESIELDSHELTNAGKQTKMKGNWNTHFDNQNPVVLELACGGGEYTVALAAENADKNFIGVDIKGNRIWKGATNAKENGLENVAFVRTRIEFIDRFFDKDEVDEIWITFPDPFLKKSKANRRLTAPGFLERYKTILKKDGFINLKTDDPTLYEFTLEVIESLDWVNLVYQHDNIYGLPELPNPALSIKTKYEGMHLEAGKTIKYVRFTV